MPKSLKRDLAPQLLKAAGAFPVVLLMGPRFAGKAALLRLLFPKAVHLRMDDPVTLARFRNDPESFVDDLPTPAILSEVQQVPELFPLLRAQITKRPRLAGQWFLIGSQEAALMRAVTGSLSGRAAVLRLHPLSSHESPRVGLLHGGHPEALARTDNAQRWHSEKMRAYLERDVRAVTNVRDTTTFLRFMALLATKQGQVLNKTDLAAPLGVSVPTITQWLHVLETTFQVIVVPPYYEDLGKRLIKSPKVYFTDSGTACHLLGIEDQRSLDRSTFAGALFEGYVASEIVKTQLNRGLRPELYHFRDEQGLAVDFVIPRRNGGAMFVACRYSRTPADAMVTPLLRLGRAFKETGRVPDLRLVLRDRDPATGAADLVRGVKALDVGGFVQGL